MWVALALSLLVIAYNNMINRWGPFHSWAYVPVNVAFAVTTAAVVAVTIDLSASELGLRAHSRDLLLPLAFLGFFALGAFGVASSPHAHRIADRRVAGLRGGPLAWYVLVRIPLGTAVTEELLFRGVLFAAWRDAGTSTVVAASWTAAAFGLWHISPTLIGVRINDPVASRRKLQAAVIGAVMFTMVAGLGLTWLRVEADGLLAPIVLHAGINSVGTLAAVFASSDRDRRVSGSL